MSFRKLALAAGLALTLAADLPDWISTIEVRTKLEDAFYRTVTFGANALSWRKPPKETRPALSQQIQQTPADAQLYYLRAREAEAQLDFPAAEADWAKYAQIAPNRAQGWRDKAAFHQRRAEPEKELAALLEAAKLPAAGAEIYRPVKNQQAWQALERAAQLVPDHLLSDDRALDVLRAREARFPKEPESYSRFAAWLIARQRWNDIEALLARYQAAFPNDSDWPLQLRASIEKGRNGASAAIALYERSLRPDSPESQLVALFNLLDEANARPQFAAAARQRQIADPSALDPAARLFHHFRLSGDTANAQRVLHDLSKARNGQWTPAEQLLLAGFHVRVQNFEEAARRYHAAYLSNDANASETGLAGLIHLLIQHASQPFRFGGGDLSFYRDIATLDTNPGFWNGIISLVLNGQSPAAELATQERKAVPYFHRSAAAELLKVFDTRFPQSARRPALHAELIQASSLHSESDRLVRLGTAFLSAFPSAPQRTEVALLTADAHARLNQTQPEYALYDALLNELAAKAGRVPIGETPAAARNAEYPRVLDRYIARLVATRQPAQALALYRREIDRNPNDPGLYERLAAFLEQNKMTAEIEATYRKAIQQFPDKSWSHKLARFFLRQKMTAQYDAFTRDVAAAFSGTELAEYLSVSQQQGALDPFLYRQVNLYAYRRFPHHIPFVKNLLSAYSARPTADPVEWERLLRANWVYDEALRNRFFEFLSRTDKLNAELAAIQPLTRDNPAAALWFAEAEAWKGHFESAAPHFKTVAADFPADKALVARAAAVHRSLHLTDTAIQLEESLAQAHPTDPAILTRLGEMQADQERFAPAAAYWARIIAAAPGRPANYLETATLHWDYYRYDEALARIAEGRRRLNNPRLFAFEAGAIRENQGDLAAAAREYVAAAIDDGPESNARQRLIRVATRPAWRQPVDAALAAAANPAKTLALRVALLESQSRKQDIENLLTQAAQQASPDLLIEIRQHAQRSGLINVERRVLDRQYSLAGQPAAKMASLAERIRFEEAANAQPAAAQFADTLLRENPRSLGAIRTAVNFHWRAGSKSRAAEILLAAAPNAYPDLQRRFRLEAISKLSDAGDFTRAHREAAALLTANPLDEQVIALKADAFARAKDDSALSAFYKDTLARFQAAKRSTASLRRAWIPALIRLNDSNGAGDQYIELLKLFPEDEALQREAARFAAASGQRERITSYFAKAESDSPRDARWPIVRARLENEFGDFNAALAAWGRAVALRPERVDLLANRARLEERLSQFHKAVISYRKLFEISFRNPTWLEEGARVLARQGKNDDCLKWLREAYIDNRPPSPNNGLDIAARLLEWGLPEPARAEVQKSLAAANSTTNLDLAGELYARAATRLRQLDSIPAALNPKTAGMTPDRQGQFRQRYIAAAAATAGALYTPEEKVRFGLWLEAQRAAAAPDTLANAALQAGLADTAARIYNQALLAAPNGNNAPGYLDQLSRLQTQRQQFAELGRQIEAYARVYQNAEEKSGLLRRARTAFFAAGDDAGELRLLASLQSSGTIADDELDRLFELSTRRAPATLTPAQLQNQAFMDSLANYAIRTAKSPVVNQAIASRRSPLWQNAARAITGLYFGENSPAVRKAFLDSLGPERIGDKLALAGNRDATLAGDIWFYYAGRYGSWLQLAQDSNSPHYLAALVERRSNSAAAYLALAEESAPAAAEQAYKTALILDEHQPIAYNRLASLAQSSTDKAALYRKTIDELRWWQDNRRIQPWFWSEAAAAMQQATAAGLANDIKDPVDTLIRAYVKRNGAYRVRELLEAALTLAGDPAAGVQWIAQISRSAADPAGFLAQLNNESWLPESGRESLLKLQTDFAVDRFNKATGDERAMAQEQADAARIRYANYLLTHNRAAAARPVVDALWSNPDLRPRFDVAELRLLLAASEKRVDAVLNDLPKEPESLRNLGNTLRKAGYPAEARSVLFASYELDLRNGAIDSAIPGLAALHIEAGAPEKAVPLLDVYIMQADVPFARHLIAGNIFLNNKRKAEAVRYLEPLVAAEPWNRAARALLAEARDDAAALAAVASDPATPYADRLRAAQWIAANAPKPIQSGAGELDLIASNAATGPAAEQPLWAAARRTAATAAKDNPTKIRLLRAVLAIEPKDDPSALQLFRLLLASGRPREASSSIDDRQHLLTEPEDRARLADCYVRINQLPRALSIFEEILDHGTPEQTRRWRAAAAVVRAQAARDEQNQLRRPVLAEQLEQSNIVMPRLTAPQGGAR
jgi:tetratricopeptide (TPR) repeat protein